MNIETACSGSVCQGFDLQNFMQLTNGGSIERRLQVAWPSRVAAFRGLLEETLKVNKGRPEEGSASLATALVAGELGGGRMDGGIDEGKGYVEDLQAILQNALQRLKVGPPLRQANCSLRIGRIRSLLLVSGCGGS